MCFDGVHVAPCLDSLIEQSQPWEVAIPGEGENDKVPKPQPESVLDV